MNKHLETWSVGKDIPRKMRPEIVGWQEAELVNVPWSKRVRDYLAQRIILWAQESVASERYRKTLAYRHLVSDWAANDIGTPGGKIPVDQLPNYSEDNMVSFGNYMKGLGEIKGLRDAGEQIAEQDAKRLANAKSTTHIRDRADVIYDETKRRIAAGTASADDRLAKTLAESISGDLRELADTGWSMDVDSVEVSDLEGKPATDSGPDYVVIGHDEEKVMGRIKQVTGTISFTPSSGGQTFSLPGNSGAPTAKELSQYFTRGSGFFGVDPGDPNVVVYSDVDRKIIQNMVTREVSIESRVNWKTGKVGDES